MKRLLMPVMPVLMALMRYLTSHPGKAVAYVVLADALIAMPDLLGWAAAAFLLYRAAGELRIAFRQLDAQTSAPRPQEPGPQLDVADVLDQATALNMTARGDLCPAVIANIDSDVPATGPVRRVARLPGRA